MGDVKRYESFAEARAVLDDLPLGVDVLINGIPYLVGETVLWCRYYKHSVHNGYAQCWPDPEGNWVKRNYHESELTKAQARIAEMEEAHSQALGMFAKESDELHGVRTAIKELADGWIEEAKRLKEAADSMSAKQRYAALSDATLHETHANELTALLEKTK